MEREKQSSELILKCSKMNHKELMFFLESELIQTLWTKEDTVHMRDNEIQSLEAENKALQEERDMYKSMHKCSFRWKDGIGICIYCGKDD